jgi:hypothetical protein
MRLSDWMAVVGQKVKDVEFDDRNRPCKVFLENGMTFAAATGGYSYEGHFLEFSDSEGKTPGEVGG